MENFAKPFLILGFLFLCIGLLILYGNKIPFLNYLGKLPGDIRIEKENFRLYFPLATSILVSILISLVLFLIQKFKSGSPWKNLFFLVPVFRFKKEKTNSSQFYPSIRRTKFFIRIWQSPTRLKSVFNIRWKRFDTVLETPIWSLITPILEET